MWQQFLRHPACQPVSSTIITQLHFPSSQRKDYSMEERLQELELWQAQMPQADFLATLYQQVFHTAMVQCVSLEDKIGFKLYMRIKQRYPRLLKAYVSLSQTIQNYL